MGALALTSKAAYREPFEPLPGDVTFVPYGDEQALARGGHRPDRRGPARAYPGRGRGRGPARGYLAARADRRRARRPALARRDPDRDGPDRRGSPTRRWWRRARSPSRTPTPRHRDGGQGAGAVASRSAPASALGAAGDAAPAGQPRHDLRRQPGRLRRGTRGDRHHRGRGAARARHGARPEAPRRPGRRPPGHRGPGRGAADRPRPRRGEVAPRSFAAALEAGFIVNNPDAGRIRLAPPLVLTEPTRQRSSRPRCGTP